MMQCRLKHPGQQANAEGIMFLWGPSWLACLMCDFFEGAALAFSGGLDAGGKYRRLSHLPILSGER